MKSVQSRIDNWSGMSGQPKLTDGQWNMAMSAGVILLVMAVLQASGFSDFKNVLSDIGLSSSPALWAALIMVAEVWGALGFFKLRLNNLARGLSGLFALSVSFFWFYENLKLLSEGAAGQLSNSGFFGKYLHQSPSWWTVVEASLFLFWVLYVVKLTWGKNK